MTLLPVLRSSSSNIIKATISFGWQLLPLSFIIQIHQSLAIPSNRPSSSLTCLSSFQTISYHPTFFANSSCLTNSTLGLRIDRSWTSTSSEYAATSLSSPSQSFYSLPLRSCLPIRSRCIMEASYMPYPNYSLPAWWWWLSLAWPGYQVMSMWDYMASVLWERYFKKLSGLGLCP